MGDWQLLFNDATFQATLSNTDGTVITADCAPGPDGFVEATAHYGGQKIVKTTECTNCEWSRYNDAATKHLKKKPSLPCAQMPDVMKLPPPGWCHVV